MSNIRVAVRVRPLNKKEKDEGSKEIIQVKGEAVTIENVKLHGISEIADSRERIKHFIFDHCYDCMGGDSTTGTASQAIVFQDLGTDVLQAAFDGFNACVFAYGQTGTGKTYTMMGQEDDIGLIPRICEGLFSHVADLADDNVTCRIDISYYEIYNERVRDLLQPELLKQNEKYSLKVREHPKEGPYVKDLSWHRVKDNNEIQALLDTGNDNRVTAETYMHEHSSRSHAIVTICFTQARLEENRPSEIVSKVHLVDLAGSERADPSSKPGFRKRLTEGSNINRSLVTLGYIIKTLAEKSLLSWSTEDMGSMQNFQSSGGGESMATSSPSGPNKQRLPYIPYRDSVLTWLLKDSLGGNSKTIMIATITPASQYYSETISTLRYAQRAKNIINKPRINEDDNVALIRELRKEIERLHNMLAEAQSSGNLLTLPDSEDSRIAERLHENEEMAKQLTQSWMYKWSSTHDVMKESDLSIRGLHNRTSSMGVMIDSQLPYLVAMDDDILSTGICIFHLKEGETLIGREDADREQDIVLPAGPSIEKEHCFIQNLDGGVTLVPNLGAMCAVQDLEITEPTRLSQGDYIVLGGNQVFRFNNPTEAAKLREHRRSQGSLSNLSTSRLSFGGLSRASSYSSIMSEDHGYLSPHSQFLKSSYPNYADADLCMDLERRYKSETERIEEAKKELQTLQEQHEKSEEFRQEKEEEMYQLHDQHRQEIEDQRRHLAQLIEENQRAREKAEEELELARESLAKEKEAFQRQLAEERERLKELKLLESLAVQTEPLQTSSIATDPDLDVFSQGTQGDLTKLKYSGGRKLSVEDQIQELEELEFERKLSYRETEQSLSIQQEDLEDQYNSTQDQIVAKMEKIKQIEEEYKELDKAHLKEISDQKEKLERLRKKETELEVYIEEKEDLLKVKTDVPRPLRNAASEMFLLSPELKDISYPQKTTSLSDIQAGMNEASGDERTPLSASTESLKSPRPVSPVAMDITGKPMESARGKNEHVKRKHDPEDKHSNISSVAKNVTSRLYQPPEPKFKYVPKSKQKEIKTASGRHRNPKERDLDAIGRGSPPRILRNQNTRHSPSPQRDLSRSGSNSPSRFTRSSDKRQSPSPLRQSPSPLRQSSSPLRQSLSPLKETGRKSSTSPAKGKGKVIDSSAGNKEGKPPLKKADPKSVTNKEAKRDGHDAPRTDKKESLIMAVRNKAPVDNTAALIDLKMRRSPDRLGVAPNRHVVTSPMRQMASTSSLASVPESLHEEDGGPLGSSSSSQQLIKKRNKRGRALLDEDEFRRHSAPDYDKLENEFNAYSKEMMGFNPSEKENVSVSPTYKTSVSVDESELQNSQLPEESDTAFSAAAAKSATSETQTNHDQIEKEQSSKFYVSSSDEMTSEETENMKEPTECSNSEIVLETISDQSENNVSEDGICDVKATAETKNDIEPEAILIGMKRDHIDGPNDETLSIPPVKKSKSHEHDHTQLSAEAALKKEHDESFSNDSLDEEENSDSIQKNKDAIHTDRLTQSLPDNLLLLKENREKSVSNDSLEATEDDTKDNLDYMDFDAGADKTELAEMNMDIVINQSGDMLQVEVVDNSLQPEIEDSLVDISDSRETDFQDEDPETFIVTLDIKTDESVSVPSLEDTNNSGTSVKDNVCNVDKVDSENQITNNEEHLEKLKNVNVVSSNLAKDMVDGLVHEELEVHLALEGETMLTHEEIEVELKLEGESCVLGSEGRREPSSENNKNNDKLESEHKALSIKTESFKNVDDETNDVIMNHGTTESNTDDNERVEEIMEISEADKLESTVNKLDSTVLIGNSENDGISATEIFDKCRTIAVWTSQEFIADMDTGLEGAGGLGSDDSLLDPSKELKVLQEALEQLPAKSSSKDGPQLSTARRAARQRAMIRKEQRTTDSDGVSAQSDGSPTSGNLSKSSSRPGSGSRRRRRPNGRGLAQAVSEHTTDEYASSDSDSLYSDDSLRGGSDKSGERGNLVNGTSGNRRLDNIRPSDLEISEVESKEMPPKHLRTGSGRRLIRLDRHTNGVEINSFDGGRSVGIQTNRSNIIHSSSSTKTDTSDEFDISFASGDYSSIVRNMVVSPLSLWSNNDRRESDSSDQNSSSSAGVKVRLSDADRSITPTPRSSARSNLSVFSFKSNIDKGPTEVWSSSASDLRKLPGFNEELGFVIETEGMWPGQSSLDYSEDAQSQRSFNVRTPVEGERLTPRPLSSTPRLGPNTPRSRSATPNGAKTAAKVVHVQYPDGGQSVNSEAFSLNVPVKYQVTIHEDNTNIMYNVDKTEYKTYALRNQSDTQPAVIPDTIHVDLKESVTSKKHEKFESNAKEDIVLQKSDNKEDSGDDSLILERSFKSSCSSERELSVENGAIPQETYKELTEKNEQQTCQVPLQKADEKDKKKKKNVELCQSGIIANTEYPGDDKGAMGEDKESLGDESDTTSDYGTFTSIDGRKGLATFTSDSEDGDMASPGISPRASHVSARRVERDHEEPPTVQELQLNQLPEQNKIFETSEETVNPLEVEGQQLCSVQEVVNQPVVAARLQSSSPIELVQSLPNSLNENGPHSKSGDDNTISSNDEIYLSLEKLETSTSSSDYLTPQQSPESVSRLVTDVEIPDIDSDLSSLSPTPRQSALGTDEHNKAHEHVGPIPEKAMAVRTVSVNTEAVSLVSHSPAITQQTFFDENDPAFTEQIRKELEKKIATLTHKERSLSDSAISSDFTDGDSSPRGSRFYDSGKLFGESYLRHIGPHGRFHGVYNAAQSPSQESGQVTFDAPSVKRSLFADSGNVYDHEDEEKDKRYTEKEEKLSDRSDETTSKATGTYDTSLNKTKSRDDKVPSKDVEKISQISEKAFRLQLIPPCDAVEQFPERLSDAVLAIKPYSYPRSVSLDGLSTLVNVDTHLSRAVRNIKADADRNTDPDSQKSLDTRLQQLDQNQNFMQDNVAPGELMIRPESRVENKAALGCESRSRMKGKSTSLSNLDPVQSKSISRSLSEANIDDFEENDTSSSSSDSITFVFVDKNNKRMEHVIMDDDGICMQDAEGYDQEYPQSNEDQSGDYSGSESQSPDSKLYSGSESQSPDFKCYSESESQSPDIRIYAGRESQTPESRPFSVTESQSPDSRPISGLAPSGTESEDGFPGGFQSEEVTGRSFSRHSDNIVDIVGESSSESDSEENEEIVKINGTCNQNGDSRETHVRMENVSPPSYTDPSDEQTQSDGLDQNVTNSGSVDDKPLRHKFGIDESILPIPERAMSADNLPKHKLKFKDIQRSRSADMVEVGGMTIQESEEGIFPPAIVQGDDDQTDPSMSLRTMSEGGLDPVSQRTVSELGMTYSSRTSSELDSVTSESDSSISKVKADRNAEGTSDSSDEEYQEEITIEYAKAYQTESMPDYEPGMVKVMPVADDSRGSPSSASEGEVDASILQNDEHIREVLRTVEKFIMPKQALVDHATSTDDANCSRFVSVGVQTTGVDSETQTVESTPIHVNPDQIILPALSAPFRAQSMDSFGLGVNQPTLVLSEGSDNWYTLGQLMVETTQLLRRINERLPDIENRRIPLPSSEESQAILKKWQEISVQTGYSLTDLTTVGLQTDGGLTGLRDMKAIETKALKRSAESTQIDKQFKMEPLEVSEVVTSDMRPGSAERLASEMSVQTEAVMSELSSLSSMQQINQTEKDIATADQHINDTKFKPDSSAKNQQMSAPLKQVTLPPQSAVDEPAKTIHTAAKPAILSANSTEIEALRKEHAKLIENLRNASASRTDRQEKIKTRKVLPENITEEKDSEKEMIAPVKAFVEESMKPLSSQEIVKVNIQMSPRSGVTVENTTSVTEEEIVKVEKKRKGILHEQMWRIAGDGNLMTVSDEKPDFTSDRSRTTSDTSFSSEGTIESEIGKAIAGSENIADPVEYAAARAGALNPLFKNEDDVIDDVLGEDIIKPEKREVVETQPVLEKMIKRLVIKPELFYGDSAEMYAEPDTMPQLDRNKSGALVSDVEPSIYRSERNVVQEPVKSLTSPKFKRLTDVAPVPLVRSTALSPVRKSAPRFGQSDDSTQVSMEFSDDFTQTDPDTSGETVIQVHTGKDRRERRPENSQIVPSKVNTVSNTPVKARPEDSNSNSMTRELERLQNERGDIMELLSLHYLPTSLTVELLEAKLNYCIGQTDLLLGTLDENYKPADRSRGTVVDQQFAKEYITKYRSDLKKSKLDILMCRERLNMGRVGAGRGRQLHRNQDLYHARRLAQIEAFRLERMREQQDYERSKCSTPIKGNTPLRGNTPLKGNSPIATPRSNISRDSSPDYSPAYMTPKEHKDHYKDLRKQLIRNVLDEERHHTRSCSPTLLSHHPDNRQLDASFGFSPKVSVSGSNGLDKSDVQAYTVAPGTHTDSPRTSSMDRYPHLSANYYQHPQPVHPQHKLDTKMTAESIFSPQESEQILREIREIQRRTQMSPGEDILRTSSFSSTHSSRSGFPVRGGLSPRGHSNITGPHHRSLSPTSRHSESLNLNLESLHDSRLSDLEDSRPYSPYSAYAREHIIPNERPHDHGVLRGSYELYDSMPRDRSYDRSHDRPHDGSHDPDHGGRLGLDGQRLSRLRPVSSSDVKARLGRHKSFVDLQDDIDVVDNHSSSHGNFADDIFI